MPVVAQQRPPADRPVMSFEAYDPRSTLTVPGAEVRRAKYPVIDVHNHQPRRTVASVDSLVGQMDGLNLRILVDLSGGTGEALAEKVRTYRTKHAGRFVVFANLDFRGIDAPDWGAKAAAQLERDVTVGGAQGLKIFKNLGMDVRDAQGRRFPTNDPKFDPVWAKAGELKIPVLIHTAEPAMFFEPVDERNERWLELTLYPGRRRPVPENPSFEALMAEQHDVFRKHPKTTFINAHLGWYGQDLVRLGQLMDRYPNMVTEFGAVIYEPARQPKFARQFFVRYQDRILFGKDSWVPEEYKTYFRVLESGDEYFPYHKKYHAFWPMYGMELPDEVLKKVYYKNALRIIPGLDAKAFPR
jgi:predicted TIM-barrel fold metal-dependent hydrolase